MKLIYLIDDDFGILQLLSKWLTLKKFNVRTFSGSVPLFIAMETQLPDIILLDIVLKDENGRHICKQIKESFLKKIPVILFSSYFGSLKEAKADCADDYIDKTAGIHKIISLLETHMKTNLGVKE